MVGLLAGGFWLPFTSDLRIRNCADPPKRPDIVKALAKQMLESRGSVDGNLLEAYDATRERINRIPPSTFWLLQLLSTINPEHYLFAKDYVKPREVSNKLNR